MMGKLGVTVTNSKEALRRAGGGARPSSEAEPMTQEQGSALLAHVLDVAGGTVLLGAKVLTFDTLDVPDVIVFEDGRRYYVGPPVEEEVRGAGIVAAASRAGEGRAAPEGASLTGPPFKAPPSVLLPEGERDREVEGPWSAYPTGPGWYQPYDSLRSRFEGREFTSVEGCVRRCWFLNELERGTGLAGMPGETDQERYAPEPGT